MDQLKGSLRFIPLSSVTQFIAGLGSTGHLKVAQGNWSGHIALHVGQIVAAELGNEHGRAALEGMLLALTDAEFAFVEAPVEPSEAALVRREELGDFMAGLIAERARLNLPAESALGSVPCLIDQEAQADGEPGQITIPSAALQLIPALVQGQTLEQIALRRGLARTLRDIAVLRSGGLVRLQASPAQQAPAPRPIAAVRPLRSVPLSQPPAAPRRAALLQRPSAAATAPAPIELPRPRLLSEQQQRSRLEAIPGEGTPSEQPGRAWHHALLGFFVARS